MSKEEVIEELRNYVKKGYCWRIMDFNVGSDKYEFYIWPPNNKALTSKGIVKYFKGLKRLEFGNKEQIEMKKCLDLIALLLTDQKLYKNKNPYKNPFLLSPHIVSSENVRMLCE
jgi:hypothetical protein